MAVIDKAHFFVKYCPQCRVKRDKNTHFCGRCGEKLKTMLEAEDLLRCGNAPHCMEFLVDTENLFCTACGKKVEEFHDLEKVRMKIRETAKKLLFLEVELRENDEMLEEETLAP